MAKRRVCRVTDVPENEVRQFEAEGGLKLAVANSAGEFFGFQANCPHQEVALCEGLFDGSTLTCHMHLWQWDIRTGEPLGIAEAPLQTYALAREGDEVYLQSSGTGLEAAPLFSGVSEDTAQALNAIAQREEFPEGGTLYRMGDPAPDFYVLESGRVEFLIGRGERMRPAGFILGTGEVFGWHALLEHQPYRIAQATCRERSSVLRVSGKEAQKIFESDPRSGYLVMRRLAELIARYMSASGAK